MNKIEDCHFFFLTRGLQMQNIYALFKFDGLVTLLCRCNNCTLEHFSVHNLLMRLNSVGVIFPLLCTFYHT